MTTPNDSSLLASISIAAAERDIEQALCKAGAAGAEQLLIADFLRGDDARRLAMFSALLGRSVVQHLRRTS